MSKNPLLWKFLLIGAILLCAAFFSYPPSERIALGLDLRGGAHVMLQVDTESAVRYQLELTQTRIGQALKQAGLSYGALQPGGSTIEITGTDPAQADAVRRVLEDQTRDWSIDSRGAGGWGVTMPTEVRQYYATSAVDATVNILRNRMDSLGVSERVIQKEGIAGDRVLVQLPGVEDPERIKGVITHAARLEWKAVTYPPGVDAPSWSPPADRESLVAQFGGSLPPDTEAYPEPRVAGGSGPAEVWWPLKRVSTVGGNDLKNAYRSTDQWGAPAVSFELSQDAGARFAAATREYIGRRMAIVLDDKVISAPRIQSEIRDTGQISGGFGSDIKRAEDLALQLRSGAIPADVRIIEERTVGPSLGRDSIRAGMVAGTAGFLAIMLFMLVYYRLSGVNAIVALALNVLLVFGLLGALPYLFAGPQGGLRATLTLPGIAGLILTVGMAVDTNVLIFERIREELRLGKTVRSAVDQGFSKAFATIIDCHVTTVVSSIFLGVYGTGPVRGFAVTLIIGLMASMFTGVYVARQLFELVLNLRRPAESLSI